MGNLCDDLYPNRTKIQERLKRREEIHSGPYIGQMSEVLKVENAVERDLGMNSTSATFSLGAGYFPSVSFCVKC